MYVVIMSSPASFTSCPPWLRVPRNMSKGERSLEGWMRSRESIVGKFLASGVGSKGFHCYHVTFQYLRGKKTP